MLQTEMEIITVEALMVCPLSQYIHFSANECGYKGTCFELIANWVHPLFLKADKRHDNSRKVRKVLVTAKWTRGSVTK